MVLPAESKSASMRNGVSRLEYITNPEPLQIGNDFQTRIFKEFLHMFSRESRALARVCTKFGQRTAGPTAVSRIKELFCWNLNAGPRPRTNRPSGMVFWS